MTKSAILGLPQTANCPMVSFNQYDSTTLKDFFIAGANDSVISAIGVSSSDSASKVAKLYYVGPSVGITSITRSGATATATFAAPHGMATGSVMIVSGAVESEYNGQFVVTESSATVVTYTVSGTPASPATGTIVARIAEIIGTLATVITGGKDTAGSVAASNLLSSAMMPWLKLDSQGNYFLTLPTGYKLMIGMVAAVTAAKNITFVAQGADY